MPSYKVTRKKSDKPATESIYKKGISRLGQKLSDPIESWKAYRKAKKSRNRPIRTQTGTRRNVGGSPTGRRRPPAPTNRATSGRAGGRNRPAAAALYSRSRAQPGAMERNRQINFQSVRVAGSNAVLLLFLVSFFQVMTTAQLLMRADEEYIGEILWVFALLVVVEWAYYVLTKILFRRKTYELEALAFFLSGVGLTVLAATQPKELKTQFIALLIGVALYTVMVWFMKDVERMLIARYVIGAGVLLIFVINLLIGRGPNGTKHWIYLGSFSIQPSEILKIGFIIASVSTLERHQTAKNLGMFIVYSLCCIGALVVMQDFGMALIYFTTFLIIAFIRSGDVRNIALVTGGGVGAAVIAISFRPYIAKRFEAYGKVWEYADSLGYQQTQTLIAAASGGLFGVGIGNGNLKYIAASNNDLVFGLLIEEWGLIFAALVVLAFCALVFYAMTCAPTARSTFYSITACAAAGLLLFQTCLNIFGATDILPLTGVTLPFISKGGTSLMATWGLIAFIKAVDGRTYAKRGAIL